ncbi:MAG TPA: retropepsin-like aspartic protease [Acidobacteriota bacterium]|nr:retropepsin-like aspartic protease [Acidobacteriota bacterium]
MKRLWSQSFLAALSAYLASGASFSVNPATHNVPFELHGHLMVVEGSIGELDGLNFVLDTGASFTVISRQVAKRLGLEGESSRVVKAYGKKRTLQEVTVSSLSVGGLRFDQVPALVGKLSFAGMDRPIRMDALIGLELMRRTSLTIDYEASRIVFGPVEHSAFTFAFYGRLPVVPVPLTIGGQRVSLLLDTGSEHIILYQRRVDGNVKMKRTGEKSEIRCLGRKAILEQVRLENVSMGATEWNELVAYLIDVPVGKSDPDGILGVLSLGLKRLNLDFQANRISWER